MTGPTEKVILGNGELCHQSGAFSLALLTSQARVHKWIGTSAPAQPLPAVRQERIKHL